MIGVLGGTFDPVHFGHLRPAQEVFERLSLSELRLVPAGQPPHRPVPVASGAQRLQMLELAIRGMRGFRTDDRELRRSGPSYTILTLGELRAELGAAPLCLLIGMDQFRVFESWHRWQEIPELAHLVILERPGSGSLPLPAWARPRQVPEPAALHDSPGGRLAFLAVSPQDISASRIRAACARGESLAGLVPEAVRDYIQAKRLYGHSDRGA